MDANDIVNRLLEGNADAPMAQELAQRFSENYQLDFEAADFEVLESTELSCLYFRFVQEMTFVEVAQNVVGKVHGRPLAIAAVRQYYKSGLRKVIEQMAREGQQAQLRVLQSLFYEPGRV